MVKTYEELTKEEIDPKKFEVLFNIVFRYIKEAYKQFKWIFSMEKNVKGVSSIWNIVNKDNKIFIKIINNYGRKKQIRIEFSVFHPKHSRQSYQDFPVEKELTPKEISRLARLIFKWIKSELEKISEF